jgi:hypothetical protein
METVEKICLDLNIKFDEQDLQDWGIIHSNQNRVQEFISYYKNHNLSEISQYYLFELIVASYNDALLEKLVNENVEKVFINLITESSVNLKTNIIKDYWGRIYNEENFPVGKYFK